MAKQAKSSPGKCEIIAADFFQSALQKTEDENIEIVSFDAKPVEMKGDSYGSSVYHIVIKAKALTGDKAYNLFVKKTPEDELRQKLFEELKVYKNEREVYCLLFPAMMQFQKSKGTFIPLSVPKIFSHASDTEQVLIFENLLNRDYKMADKYMGLDNNHCMLVMEKIAQFHAISYCMMQSIGKDIEEEFPCLKKIQDFGGEEAQKSRDAMTEQSYNNAILTVTKTDPELADKMKKLCGSVAPKMNEIVLNKREGPHVIIHGDLWANNMLFLYETRDGRPVPVDVKFVDFQATRVACLTGDLSYFFHTSTTLSLRQKYLQQLLRHYHSTFLNTIHLLGVDLAEFTFEAFQKRYDKDLIHGCLLACVILPLMLARPEESIQIAEMDQDVNKISESFQKQMEVSAKKMQRNQPFLDRLYGIALDMDEHGLLT